MVTLGLINPKSATNVAGIVRAAGCYGASSIVYTGQRFRYAKEFSADTKSFHRKIPTIGVDSLFDFVPVGAAKIAVELVVGATPLPEYRHPENAFYIFGPEDGSIDENTLAQCDDVVYIPTRSCMNLAATANVLLYDRMCKNGFSRDQSLIEQSRDNNNNSRLPGF